MKKYIILTLLIGFNIEIYAGTMTSDNGRIRIWCDPAENSVLGQPRYTVDNGGPIELPVSSGYTGYAWRISGDADVISGQLFNIDENGVWEDYKAAVWQQTQIVDDIPLYSDALLLSSLEGDYYESNWVYDMSLNGEYIVGYCSDYWGRHQAVYWDENRDVHSLGSMYYDSLLYNCTDAGDVRDDKVIVGMASGEGAPSSLGFIWDQEHGMRYIKDVLEQEYGYDFGDSILESAGFWDPHGTIINGSGYTSTGELFFWSAEIPEPATIAILAFGSLLLRLRSGQVLRKRM